MTIYLVSTEPAGREIAHRDESSAGAFLCTKEFADQYSLMHYRRGGEKKGVRRWQNEDGSYTKAGYEHYAEMYGWGKFRADRAEKKAEKYRDKAIKAEEKLNRQKLKTDKVQYKTNLDQQKLDRYNKKHSTSASGAPITPTPSKQSKAVDKDTEKLQKENNRLQEAQIKFDKLSNKAEKYQNKADRIHKKWDKQTKNLEYEAKNERDAEAYFRHYKEISKDDEKESSQYADLEKGASSRAEKYEKELQKRGISLDKNNNEMPMSGGINKLTGKEWQDTVNSTFKKMDKLVADGDDTQAEELGYRMADAIRWKMDKKAFDDVDTDIKKEMELHSRRGEIMKEISYKSIPYGDRYRDPKYDKLRKSELERLNKAIANDKKLKSITEENLALHKSAIDSIIRAAGLPDDERTRDWVETLIIGFDSSRIKYWGN